MSGRKSLILISPILEVNLPASFSPSPDYIIDYLPPINRLADEAMRTGVVIHLLDIKGTGSFSLPRSRNEYLLRRMPPGGITVSSSNFLLYILAEKTGGIEVSNSNFYVDGIGSVHEGIKGYYLLSYIPPTNTFKPDSRGKYHQIEIKVKRRFSKVYTRDGFFGEPTPSDDGRFVQKNDLLQEAIFSPFFYDDLKIRLASGYASGPETGYFLRSWMHLDADDLTFMDEQDGGHAVSLEVLTLTTDINGLIQDGRGGKLDFYVENKYLDRIRNNGIGFEFYLPVKTPGAYYVRAAVKDEASGKIGTAYQFLKIPDLKEKRLSLSSIFAFNHGENLWRLGSEGAEEVTYGSSSVLDRQQEGKNPAIRSYLPGEGFDYIVFAYNATQKRGLPPDLESQFTLYKDEEEFTKGNIVPVAIDIDEMDDFSGIPITRRLIFEESMAPGRYVLQLMVKDKQAKEENSIATQAIDFEIRN